MAGWALAPAAPAAPVAPAPGGPGEGEGEGEGGKSEPSGESMLRLSSGSPSGDRSCPTASAPGAGAQPQGPRAPVLADLGAREICVWTLAERCCEDLQASEVRRWARPPAGHVEA